MKWSWRFARIAGIGIYVHATFFLLLAWVAFAEYRRGGDARAVLSALVFILAIFATVVLHELGHALTAARFGIATRDITLLPIGGVARLERMPRDPKQELLVALAVLLFAFLAATGGGRPITELASPDASFLGREFVARLVGVNVWLALFNLIPAFPMDGGRVLRAVLAMRHGDYARATESAARVGRFFALVFGIVGIFVVNNPFLVFIALFVWLGAASEAAAVQGNASLVGVPAGRVMITDVRTVAPTDPLGVAVRLMLDGFQQDFPVVERGEVVGILTRRDLLKGLAQAGEAAPVASVMQRDYRVTSPDEPVEEVLAQLRSCNCQALPVVRGRELLGVLTLENVGEYMMVQSALRGADGQRGVA